jgi:hypothetical protein
MPHHDATETAPSVVLYELAPQNVHATEPVVVL